MMKDHPALLRFRNSDFYWSIRNPNALHDRKSWERFYLNFLGGRVGLIFDVGASGGAKATIFRRLAKKVVLFEPNPGMCARLSALFGEESQIVLCRCALGLHAGRETFFQVSDHDAYSSLSKKHIEQVVKVRSDSSSGPIVEYEVEVQTLDHFVALHGVPDYIKIDVEGHELAVISGLSHLVGRISFEANLPEFLVETKASIMALSRLSEGTYRFNIAEGNKFELAANVGAEQMCSFLDSCNLRSAEIYAFAD
jgi:FkbM family methyltransferase